MRAVARFFVMVAAGFLLSRCGKDKGPNPAKELPYGLSVELQPVNLPPPPAGTVYQAWLFRLENSGGSYTVKYFPYAKFGWNSYAYKFTNPADGTDMGYVFKAGPDAANLFTPNLTDFVRADTIRQIVQKLLRGQAVPLPGASGNLSGMQGFLLSLEPASDPDPAAPASPFLAAFSNDSGKFDMAYPYDYRDPEFFVSYFMATPTDTLHDATKITDSIQYRNEHRGIWFGFIDTVFYDLGRQMVRPDTVLRKLARELLPGWQFESWIERNGSRVSLGHFLRGDSADLSNPYALFPESTFAVPGEDFLVNSPPEFASIYKGVLNSTAMITLEPRPDSDPEMFPIILFRAATPAGDSGVHNEGGAPMRNIQINFTMENRARFFPKIKVRVIPEQRK